MTIVGNVPRRGWVIGILSALGSDRWQVAYNLATMGFKGVRGSTSDCPVSNYLKMFYPDTLFIVGNTYVAGLEEDIGIIFDDVPSLHGVWDFSTFFDAGEYPGLDSTLEYRYTIWGRKKTGEIELICQSNDKQYAAMQQQIAAGWYVSVWQAET